MLLWACAGVPLGVYNIVKDFNLALKLQPQILTCLSLLTWIQCKYYGSRWPWTKSAASIFSIAIIMGGIESGLVFALRGSKHRHVGWPITLMAVLSACLLCAGVLRHYWDIYTERTVRGISFLFVGIDAAGDLTSLISLVFQPSLDILGLVIYGSELVLWLGVFACGGYYNFTPWLRRKVAGSSRRENRIANGQSVAANTTALEDARSSRSTTSSRSVFRTPSLQGDTAQTLRTESRYANGQII